MCPGGRDARWGRMCPARSNARPGKVPRSGRSCLCRRRNPPGRGHTRIYLKSSTVKITRFGTKLIIFVVVFLLLEMQ